MVEAAYVGNKGSDLETSRQLNGIPNQYLSTLGTRDQEKITYMTTNMPSPYYPLLPGTGRASSVIGRASLLTPYPHYTGLTTTTNEGYSNYHALQMRADKRFTRGYTLQGTYTWAKTMEANGFLNEMDKDPYYQIADYDIPHRISVSGIYELPFGKGRSFGAQAPKWANYVIGGWQVQAIWSWQSGTPLAWGNILFYGDIKDIPKSGDQQTVEQWFNTANFERSTTKALLLQFAHVPEPVFRPAQPGHEQLGYVDSEEHERYGTRESADPRGDSEYAQPSDVQRPEYRSCQYGIRPDHYIARLCPSRSAWAEGDLVDG